jgi:hypothetical protein
MPISDLPGYTVPTPYIAKPMTSCRSRTKSRLMTSK